MYVLESKGLDKFLRLTSSIVTGGSAALLSSIINES